MEKVKVEQLTLFTDQPSLSEVVREELEKAELEPGEAVTLLELSEAVAIKLNSSKSKTSSQVREVIDRTPGFEMISVRTEKGRRAYIACLPKSVLQEG